MENKYTMYEAADMLCKDYNKVYYVCIRNGIGTQGFHEWTLTDDDILAIQDVFTEREKRRRKK